MSNATVRSVNSTRLPAMPSLAGLSPELRAVLAPIVEAIEIYAGARGNPAMDRAVRMADLAALSSGGAVTPEAVGMRTLGGCTPYMGADAAHDVVVSAGGAVMTDGVGNYRLFSLPADLEKRIDEAWAAGGGRGGLPSGLSLSASTMYPMWLVGNDAGRVDAGFDTDAVAANLRLESGYRWYAPVRGNFAVFTDGSAEIIRFVVKGGCVLYKTQVLDINDSNLTDGVYKTAALSVPPQTAALVHVRGYASGGKWLSVFVCDRNAGVNTVNIHLYDSGATELHIEVPVEAWTDAARQINYAINVPDGATPDRILIKTWGYRLAG